MKLGDRKNQFIMGINQKNGSLWGVQAERDWEGVWVNYIFTPECSLS